MKTRTVLVIAAILMIVCIVLFFIGYGSHTTSPSQLESGAQIKSDTEQNVPSFASALASEGQGNYAAAIPQLQAALGVATSSSQSAAILSHLEQDFEFTGDYPDAIATFQRIAGTASFPPVTRAYAVEGLGLIYERYPDATSTDSIFSQAPYTGLYVATSSNRTMRDLFSYATTIYPLPISEYYLAISYTNGIVNNGLMEKTSSTAAQQLSTLQQDAVSSFKAGETALAVITANPPTSVYLLNAQLTRAIALGDMQEVGITDLGSADDAFKTVLSNYASAGLTETDGAARLQYAYFLVTAYGPSRVSDIQSDLAPLYQDPEHHGPAIGSILAQFAGAPDVSAKSALVQIAAIDPQFKAFLVSLGWTSGDLSATSTSGTVR